jgi:hypothetical protein
MVNALLVLGYIPLSSADIGSILGRFALLALAGLIIGWCGVVLIKRDKWIGFAVVLLAIAVPLFGWRLF